MNKLRVAHVDDNDTWRGGERQVLGLMNGLRDRGVESLLVCRPGSEISRRAREHGIETAHLPLLGEWDVYSAVGMRALFVRRAVTIAHAHTSHAHTLSLFALLGNQTCGLVVSRRVDFHLNGGVARRWKYGNSVDRFIAVSDAIRNVLIQDGVKPERVVTVRSGFIPGEFDGQGGTDPRASLGIPKDSAVIVTVAALAPHKAHGALVKAAHLVSRKHPHVRFLFAGEGEMRAEIERAVRNLGLESIVTLTGFLRDLESVYRAADIFALSSSEEGLCSSLLDAMHYRLPIVATRAGGIPELVADGANGFIVPVNDHFALADRLCALIESPDLRESMAIQSAAVLKRNSISQTVEKTLEIYREVVNKRKRKAC